MTRYLQILPKQQMNEKLNVKITINFDHAPLSLHSSVDQDHIEGDSLNKLYI